MSNRRILVTGGAGQLAFDLISQLEIRDYKVIALTRGALNIEDRGEVDAAISKYLPLAVFNPAAYNQVDRAESEPGRAFSANALAVMYLASACRNAGARLVHFSTDYVFDGTLGRQYLETDVVGPIGAYGVSKLAGENYAQAYLDEPLIIRTSGVFGAAGLNTARGNFPELMLKLAASGKPIRIIDDAKASPTYSPLLAARAIDLFEAGQKGIFHVGGGEPISWFSYAKMIFAAAGCSPEVHPVSTEEYRTAARRPKFSALSNRRMEALGLPPMPALADAVRMYFGMRNQLVGR